ncbi:MAG TPA: nucleotidyl transferase AbiEii/AbiGii toxin family protein [Nitriliruptorales bacterium]|nr:nucleotidyl transferase AbiEii/AbiGii toxin family protein [Nitriliruptorales bacterium]
MLTALQERVARILGELPEAQDFALAGGAALIARGLIDRPTRDLDFFATSAVAVERLLPALRQALSEEGVEVTTIRQAPGFVRLEVTDGRETSEVDLSHDARLRPPEHSPLGSILSAEELAADKTLALFGRAEARDFLDVDSLVDRFGREQLLELAAQKDAGFTSERFAESISAIDRLQPADFRGGEATFERLRQRFHDWRRELTLEPGDGS